jgi:hypothetical protein
VNAAREYAPTAYRTVVGEDVTFEREFARLTTDKGRVPEAAEGSFLIL